MPEPSSLSLNIEESRGFTASPAAQAFLQRFLLVADRAPVLLSYVDNEERYAFINQTYEQWFGRLRSDMLGRPLREVIGEHAYEAVRPLVRRALSGEHVRYERMVPYLHGGSRRIQGELIPHFTEDGSVAGYAALITDVTAARAAELRLELLADVSHALAKAQLDSPSIFNAIVQSVTGTLADTSALFLRPEDGSEPTLAALQHIVPEDGPELRPLILELSPHARATMETGEAVLLGPMDLASVRAALPPEHLPLMDKYPLHSLLVVPVRASGAILGALAMIRYVPGLPLTREDQDALQAVADRGALSIENARSHQAAQAACRKAEALAAELRESVERERQVRAEMERALALMDSFMSSIPVGFALLDTQLRYLKVNPSLATTNGLAPEAHIGRSIRELLPEAADSLEPQLRRVMETGEPLINFEGIGATPARPGMSRHYLASFFPLRAPDGTVSGVGSASLEVTDQIRARRRMALLAEAGRRLFASLDVHETLEQVVRLLVDEMVDGCLVDLLNVAGELEQTVFVHRDPEMMKVIQELRTRYGLGAMASLRLEVIKTGKPRVFPSLPPDWARKAAQDTEHARLIHALACHTGCIVPLIVRGRALGALSAFISRPASDFHPDEVALLEEVASRAALAIDHARLYTDLQKAVRVRDEFLSVASHELKTPLTPLSLKLQLLGREVARHPETPLTQEVRDYIETGRKQIKKLTELVGDLLDVSRIGEGRLRLQKEEVDLGALVQEVSSRFEPTASQLGSALEVHVADSIQGLWDPARLEQVVTNLLDNALKYGLGRPVRVEVHAGNGHAMLTVTDHGIGIEPSQLSRIFERFERAVSDRHYGGLGLGLFITRELIHAHGGTIQVESEPGVTTTFTVSLPLR